MASLFEFMGIVPPRSVPDVRQLTRLSQDYVLRRTKDRVMTDLPPRFDRDEIIELSAAQRHAYDHAEREGVIHLNEMGESISVQHVFELVLRLKQISNFDPLTGESTKLDRLQADMDEIAASGGKAILGDQSRPSHRAEDAGDRQQVHLQGHDRGKDRQGAAAEAGVVRAHSRRRGQLERVAEPDGERDFRTVRPQGADGKGGEEDRASAGGRRSAVFRGVTAILKCR
jgi:hypothetical protein